jgi:hypothetical protein
LYNLFIVFPTSSSIILPVYDKIIAEMFYKRLKTILIILALAAIPFVYQACSQAGAPPTLIETPVPISILRFVKSTDMRVGFGEILERGSLTNSVAKVVQKPPVGTQYNDRILGIHGLEQDTFDNFFNPALNGLEKINDLVPQDELFDHFEAVVTFTDPPAAGEEPEVGLFTGTQQVTIDCSDEFFPDSFDMEGDGVTENCSGYCNELPSCVFLKLGGAPHLVWVFDEVQEEDEETGQVTSIGVGKGRIIADDLDGFRTEVGFAYDQPKDAPDRKIFDMGIRAKNNFTKQFIGFGGFINEFRQFDWRMISTEQDEVLQIVNTIDQLDCESPPGQPNDGICIDNIFLPSDQCMSVDGGFFCNPLDVGPRDVTRKTLDFASHFIIMDQNDDGVDEDFNSFALDEFYTDQPLWIGSYQADGIDENEDPITLEEPNVCADISGEIISGFVVPNYFCDAYDLDLTGEQFIAPLTDPDVAFPADLLN